MTSIRRCRRCGTVLRGRENILKGFCDKCDEKAFSVYWPNGGSYRYDTNEIDRILRKQEYEDDMQKSTLSHYFVPSSVQHKKQPLSEKPCWKCGRPNGLNGLSGLCNDCFGVAMNHLVGILGVFFYGMVALLEVPFLVRSGFINAALADNLVNRILLSVVVLVADALLLAATILFIYCAVRYIRTMREWGIAFKEYLSGLLAERQQLLQKEAKERAELAEPTRLNGMELDALLTEEYKRKQGWD